LLLQLQHRLRSRPPAAAAVAAAQDVVNACSTGTCLPARIIFPWPGGPPGHGASFPHLCQAANCPNHVCEHMRHITHRMRCENLHESNVLCLCGQKSNQTAPW
jgi:hypothetical protein